MAYTVAHKPISSEVDLISPNDQSLSAYNYKLQEVVLLSFIIIKNNCPGLDVHKTWIFACNGITDSHNRTKYKFDVAPFVDGRCKTPIEEIQSAVDGVISQEQAVKLRLCLNHIDELEGHKTEKEWEIFHLCE